MATRGRRSFLGGALLLAAAWKSMGIAGVHRIQSGDLALA
jgi:hypothetical protein